MTDQADSEIVHFVPDCTQPAACGLDVFRTPYTYGSPEYAEVDCGACLAATPAPRAEDAAPSANMSPEETMAAKLRKRGWVCVAPEDAPNYIIAPLRPSPGERGVPTAAALSPGTFIRELADECPHGFIQDKNDPAEECSLCTPPAKHIHGWRCPLPCPEGDRGGQHKSE